MLYSCPTRLFSAPGGDPEGTTGAFGLADPWTGARPALSHSRGNRDKQQQQVGWLQEGDGGIMATREGQCPRHGWYHQEVPG